MFVRMCPIGPFQRGSASTNTTWLAKRLLSGGVDFKQCSNAFPEMKWLSGLIGHRLDRSLVAAQNHGVSRRIFGAQIPQPGRLVMADALYHYR
jgi:hypothetical protein